MHFSPPFKSSLPCTTSPNGRFIAALQSPDIVVLSAETLDILHVVQLPSDVSGPIQSLLWSPSSTRILVSTSDRIHVLSILDQTSQANIRNLTPKHAHIQFGHDDAEVLVFSSFGLKLQIFDLASSSAIEIPSPKFHQRTTASRGLSLRRGSGHMALLTRVSGRDIISIHGPATRQLQRSWTPETIDAQALTWSPDGQWLLLWESPAHGWKLLLYTPDGQLVRTLDGSLSPDDDESSLKPGIKVCKLSPNEQLSAISDSTRTVSIFDTTSWRATLALVHPAAVSPSDTLQVWQEQLHDHVSDDQPRRGFIRATQEVSPAAPSTDGKPTSDTKTGCSVLAFDASSNLLATKLDDAPTTIWIWDLSAAELRAVLLFHNPVDFSWHPTIGELLLILSHDHPDHSVPLIWDPLSQGPTLLPIDEHWADGSRVSGQLQASWADWGSDTPSLLLSDSQQACVVLLSDPEDSTIPPWQLDSTERLRFRSPQNIMSNGADHEDTSILDDTFSFKHG